MNSWPSPEGQTLGKVNPRGGNLPKDMHVRESPSFPGSFPPHPFSAALFRGPPGEAKFMSG